MRIITKLIIDMETGETLLVESYEYSGPLALCVRKAQQQASNNVNTANQLQGTYEGQAQAIDSKLTPQLQAETTAQHSMSPTQINELLTAAGAGAGGATGAFDETGALNAARTRNTGGLTSALDANARGRQQALASASEGIAAQDVQGALANKQSAFSQLGAMGQADTSAAMGALGLSNQGIGQELQAGQSGWFQNLMQAGNLVAKFAGGGAGGAAPSAAVPNAQIQSSMYSSPFNAPGGGASGFLPMGG